MKAICPNLELLEYKVRVECLNNKTFQELLIQASSKKLIFTAEMFLQTWGNTATGFDEVDGLPAMSGQAFTDEYTTVFHELTTHTYIVCFGNRPCYFVYDAPHKFYEDLKNRKMELLSVAKKKY